jgi:hypothetical protein
MRRLVCTLGVIALAVCRAATAGAQDSQVDEIQSVVARAQAVYHLPQLVLSLSGGEPVCPVACYRPATRTMIVTSHALASPHRDALLAHELGHAIVHPRRLPRDVVSAELQANVKAVDVLERVMGYSRDQAVRAMIRYIAAGVRQSRLAGRSLVGHDNPCYELRQFLSIYPPDDPLHAADKDEWSSPCPEQ